MRFAAISLSTIQKFNRWDPSFYLGSNLQEDVRKVRKLRARIQKDKERLKQELERARLHRYLYRRMVASEGIQIVRRNR